MVARQEIKRADSGKRMYRLFANTVSNTQFEVWYDCCDTCCEYIISFGVKYPSTLKTFTHKQHHNTFSINQILTIKKCVISLSILHTRIQRKGVVMFFFCFLFFWGGGVQARFIHKRPTLFWSTGTHTHTHSCSWLPEVTTPSLLSFNYTVCPFTHFNAF